MMPLKLIIDGIETNAVDVTEDLERAVIISLFTWRRANPDDPLPANERNGWWGDSYPQETNDRIGSRLWLLSRGKLTAENVLKAKEYAIESLKWLIDDGVASTVDVVSERHGLDGLALGITITRGNAEKLNIRFANVWDYLNAF